MMTLLGTFSSLGPAIFITRNFIHFFVILNFLNLKQRTKVTFRIFYTFQNTSEMEYIVMSKGLFYTSYKMDDYDLWNELEEFLNNY